VGQELEELKAQVEALARRVGRLEDAQQVRHLHFKYGYYLDSCLYEQVVELFSDSAELRGVSGDKLVILGKVGCGGGTSLATYDPVTNTSNVLLGAPITKGGGIAYVLLYPSGK